MNKKNGSILGQGLINLSWPFCPTFFSLCTVYNSLGWSAIEKALKKQMGIFLSEANRRVPVVIIIVYGVKRQVTLFYPNKGL